MRTLTHRRQLVARAIGLANIIGSLVAGQAVNRFRSNYILFWMYATHAVIIVLYIAVDTAAQARTGCCLRCDCGQLVGLMGTV